MKKLNVCEKMKCFVWKWQHFQYELTLLLLNSLFKLQKPSFRQPHNETRYKFSFKINLKLRNVSKLISLFPGEKNLAK